MKYTRKQLLEASKIFEALHIAGIDILAEITFNDDTEFTLENGELTIDTKFIPIRPVEYIEIKTTILPNDIKHYIKRTVNFCKHSLVDIESPEEGFVELCSYIQVFTNPMSTPKQMVQAVDFAIKYFTGEARTDAVGIKLYFEKRQ